MTYVSRREWPRLFAVITRENIVLCVLLATPVALVLLAAYASARSSEPTDEELIATFRSHASAFNAMIVGNGNVLVPVGGSNPGPAADTKFYLYLGHGTPRPLVVRPSRGWRGPGVYQVTGDRHITGSWYIRHVDTVVVAFSPY
jgi:hypothetical protein